MESFPRVRGSGPLAFGEDGPGTAGRFIVGVRFAVPRRLTSGVAGVAVARDRHPPGEHAVALSMRGVPTKAPISSPVEVLHEAVARTIAVTGGSVGAEVARRLSEFMVRG